MNLQISDEQKKNLAVAERINRETRANPNSPYAHKYIGVWHQEVVTVGETLDEVCDRLTALGDTEHQSVVRAASADYEGKIAIWNLP